MEFGFVDKPSTIAKNYKDSNRFFYTKAMEEVFNEGHVIKTDKGFELSDSRWGFLKGDFAKRIVKNNKEFFENACKKENLNKSFNIASKEGKQIIEYIDKHQDVLQGVINDGWGSKIIKFITKNRLKNKTKGKIKDKLYEDIHQLILIILTL
jgi:hypothetical protein